MSLSDKLNNELAEANAKMIEEQLKKEVKEAMPLGLNIIDPMVIESHVKPIIDEAMGLINKWRIMSLEYDSSKIRHATDDIFYNIECNNKIIWNNRIFFVTSLLSMFGEMDVIRLHTKHNNGIYLKNIKNKCLKQLPGMVEGNYSRVKKCLYGSQEFVELYIRYGNYVLFRDGYLFPAPNTIEWGEYPINKMSVNSLEEELAKNIRCLNSGTVYKGYN